MVLSVLRLVVVLSVVSCVWCVVCFLCSVLGGSWNLWVVECSVLSCVLICVSCFGLRLMCCV